jgi:hypothetical protein
LKTQFNAESLLDKAVDILKGVEVCLTEVGRYVPAVGDDCVVLDGDDGGEFRVQSNSTSLSTCQG